MSTIIDTHCHYNLSPLVGHAAEHWQKAQENLVGSTIIVGTNFFSSNAAISIAETDPHLWASIGIHPTQYMGAQLPETPEEVQQLITNDQTELTLLLNHPKVVAIGETGLDYYHLEEDKRRDEAIAAQQLAFAMHIQLAQTLQVPLIIHVRDRGEQTTPEGARAYWDVLKILKTMNWQQPFVLHCISGPLEYVKQAVEMGAYIGVAGNITYANSGQLRELVTSVPPDRVLLETDAPYLPPQEFRGRTCEPWMISMTAKYVEEKLGISQQQTTLNARRLFTKTR